MFFSNGWIAHDPIEVELEQRFVVCCNAHIHLLFIWRKLAAISNCLARVSFPFVSTATYSFSVLKMDGFKR